jgi:FkbM family methyltransferase
VIGINDKVSPFWKTLTSELLRSCQQIELNNVDRVRFPEVLSLTTKVKNQVLQRAASLRFYRPSAISYDILEIEGLERAYGLFHDELSKDLFVKLLAYRILGHRHVRLPLNEPKYWALRRSLAKYIEKRGVINRIPLLGSLDLYHFNGIHVQTHLLGILNTFLLEQYQCRRAKIGVKFGDVTIDAGGCWGDTALYFAQLAAKVFCFECIPSNVKIIQENIALNPALGTKISIVQAALWDRSGEKLVFKDTGPGSRTASDGIGVEVETQTLDDFVKMNSLDRVDFIKMDIEGSEPEALAGAEWTIRKHRPQLAISIYHDARHLASIPIWLSSLNVGYQLFLEHFTIHEEETVLFARPGS